MESNNDLKLYIATNINHPSKTAQLQNELLKLGYDFPKMQKDAAYLILDDTEDDFELNLYRDNLKIALEKDQPIVFLSRGIPFFCKYDDGVFYTKLHVSFFRSFEKLIIEYHIDNREDFKTSLRPRIFIPGEEPDDSNVRMWNENTPPQRDKDICCYRKWKGLYY